MANHLKVRGHSDLLRDKNSKAILVNDLNSLNKYKEERDQKLKLNKIVQEHDEIKKDVADIKILLQQILGKL